MFIFPATRFVKNGLFGQIAHLESEVYEVTKAYFTPGGINHLAEELCDVVHSAETGLRIMADRYDIAVLDVEATRLVCGSLYAQITHLHAQMGLVTQELVIATGIRYVAGSIGNVAAGLGNVILSAKSALQILAERYDVDVLIAMAMVVEKNRIRGYYLDPPQRPLAETSRTEGAHSCSPASALPLSPSHQQRKKISTNHPMEGGSNGNEYRF